MLSRLSFLLVLAALTTGLACPGCTLQTQTSGAQGGQAGAAPSAGAGGSSAGEAGTSGEGGSGGAGGGDAGQGGVENDPCKGVPAEGRCLGPTTVERCVSSGVPAEGKGEAVPQVVQGTCPSGTVCKQQEDWAGCVPEADCVEGASYCEGPSVRVACVGGTWAKQPCGGEEECRVSLGGAACATTASEAGQTFQIKGTLLYEYRPVREDRKGYDAPTLDTGKGLIALAYDGDEYLGGTYTSEDDGTFAIEVPKKPTAATSLYFFPMLYDEGGVPQFAVAVPETLSYANLKSKAYYAFGRTTGEALDVGQIVVTEAEGSGAIYIHQWVLYSILQLRLMAPEAKPFNVLALWAPGKKFDCGNGTCYAPRGWGATVDYGSGKDFYEGALLIAGTDDTPHQHSASVILHEFGHYTMDAYSRSPGEAAPHSLSMLEPPGMAWSEGWATYLGQGMMQTPLYFDKQEGTVWWYNVDKPYFKAPKPDPSGPMDQKLGEANVSHMLWHLDDTVDEGWDKSNLQMPAIVQAFVSPRVKDKSLNRGYKTVDFVDFLDALRCNGAPSSGVLSVTKNEGFPYDDKPVCK
jgi:hypothetical protein